MEKFGTIFSLSPEHAVPIENKINAFACYMFMSSDNNLADLEDSRVLLFGLVDREVQGE